MFSVALFSEYIVTRAGDDHARRITHGQRLLIDLIRSLFWTPSREIENSNDGQQPPVGSLYRMVVGFESSTP